MNDDQRMADTLRDFYVDDATRAHDRDAILHGVLDSAHMTTQQRRRRWWPFRRHAGLTSPLPSREVQPDPGVAKNGKAPSSIGSVSAMFSPVRLALAGVIVALFGGFLLFGALAPQSQDGVPGVVSSGSPEASPSATDVEPTSTISPTKDPVGLETPAATMPEVAVTFIPTSLLAQEPTFLGEHVEPGVERIISDGADFDLNALDPTVRYAFEDIAAASNGDVWVVGYRYHTDTGRVEGPMAWELGSAGMYGTDAGFPKEFSKLAVLDDGTPVVVGADGIRAFDGERWVDSPGTRRSAAAEGVLWLIEPGDLAALGGGVEGGTLAPGVLALVSDGAGYAIGRDVGRHILRDWPSWWEACGSSELGYRNGTGCLDRSAQDQRGVGAGHDDERRALFLADTVTDRIAEASDGSIWVIGGSRIEELWSGRSDEGGAIYRIDPDAPGFDCRGC